MVPYTTAKSREPVSTGEAHSSSEDVVVAVGMRHVLRDGGVAAWMLAVEASQEGERPERGSRGGGGSGRATAAGGARCGVCGLWPVGEMRALLRAAFCCMRGRVRVSCGTVDACVGGGWRLGDGKE